MKTGQKVVITIGKNKGDKGKIQAKKCLAVGFRSVKLENGTVVEVHEGVLRLDK